MLSQAVGYAALSLGYLAARPDGTALVREIAEACEIPAPYLSKIINQLSRAGLVRTQRGVGGGARLAREAQSISLFELCDVLNDPAIQAHTMFGVPLSSGSGNCPTHDFSNKQRTELIAYLQGMTIADIAEFQRERAEASLTILNKNDHVGLKLDAPNGSNGSNGNH